MGEAKQRGVVETRELIGDGLEDVGVGVAMDARPDGAVPIEVGCAIDSD